MNHSKNCLFCAITQKEHPAHIIYENEHILGVLDIDPITKGHTLLIPKTPVTSLHNLSVNQATVLHEATQHVATLLQNTFLYHSISTFHTSGDLQDIPHYHLHVFGRYSEEDISYPLIQEPLPTSLKEIHRLLTNK